MFRMSASLAVAVASASRVAASTNSRPSVSTAERTRTNLRSASSPTPNLRRNRCSAGGRSQSWNGAPLRSAPGLCARRSEEHTSELQSLMRISYAVFCLKKKHLSTQTRQTITHQEHHNTNTQREQQ